MIICSAGDGADCRNNPPGVGKVAGLELIRRPDDLSFCIRCLQKMILTANDESKKPPCIRRQGMKRRRYSIVAISAC